MSNLIPAYTFSPGDTLLCEMMERDWNTDHLARITGYDQGDLMSVLYDSTPIAERLAVALSDAFGTSVEFWLNLQTNYERDLAAGAKDCT